MKKIFNCVVCDEEYKANSNTHIKTCKGCRFEHRYNNNRFKHYHNQKKTIQTELNNKLEFVRVSNTSGIFRISTNPQKLDLGMSMESIKNYDLYEKFIVDLINKLKSDLKVIKNEQKQAM